MMEWKNVSLRQRGRFRLENISLTLKPGTLTAILGPNGAGKSSFIKLCSKELSPSEGSIAWEGRGLKDWTWQDLARSRAVLSQSYHLPLPLDVEELVGMGRYPHLAGRGMRDEDRRIVSEALHLCEAEKLIGRTSTQLSGGELQRVQLARVLAQIWEPHPQLARMLLLDEPTASLDSACQHRALQLARQLARQGVCVVVVLHDIILAAQYADRIIYLKDGRLVGEGDSRSLMRPEWVREVFDVDAFEIRDERLGPASALITLAKFGS